MIGYIDLPQQQLSSGNTETRTPRNDWIVAPAAPSWECRAFFSPITRHLAAFLVADRLQWGATKCTPPRHPTKRPTCNYAQGCRLQMNIVGAGCWLLAMRLAAVVSCVLLCRARVLRDSVSHESCQIIAIIVIIILLCVSFAPDEEEFGFVNVQCTLLKLLKVNNK
eukprot:scaffold26765_cov64-Cyclotella_meneghiniana.AAC.1